MVKTVKQLKKQLTDVLLQLNNEQYARPLTVLAQSSIGMHVRHIVEFFECFANATLPNATICYDNRQRKEVLQINRQEAIDLLTYLLVELESFALKDAPFKLKTTYDSEHEVPTTFNRELLYNIEHTIHHMAIIKIALITDFEWVTIPKGFGVAYSTQRYEMQHTA